MNPGLGYTRFFSVQPEHCPALGAWGRVPEASCPPTGLGGRGGVPPVSWASEPRGNTGTEDGAWRGSGLNSQARAPESCAGPFLFSGCGWAGQESSRRGSDHEHRRSRSSTRQACCGALTLSLVSPTESATTTR